MARYRSERDEDNQHFVTKRYDRKTLLSDREYGFYWYAWLWKLLRPVLVFLASLTLIIGVGITAWEFIDSHFFMAPEPDSTEIVEFEIASGSSITGISQKLEKENFIRSSSIFKYMVQLQGLTNDIHYGTYKLSRNMGINEVLAVLTSGKEINDRTITIIPGWTCEDIADYLVSEKVISKREEFLEVCKDASTFINASTTVEDMMHEAEERGSFSGRVYQLEGYLAPDTYRIYLNADAYDIATTLLKQMSSVITKVFPDESDYQIDENGDKIEPERDSDTFYTTLTRDETMILASVIQREAGTKEDMARVSAVFHNRLKAGMRLESDPTATYLTDVKRIALTSTDISVDTQYNTYVVYGLPVGPICQPSTDAIKAALYPDMGYINGNYLFFCSKSPESGELDFSQTYEEHAAKVEKYRPLWLEYDEKHKEDN